METISACLILGALSSLPAVPAGHQGQTQLQQIDADSISTLQEIKVQTLGQSKAYTYVKELSDTVGPRLTGSQAAAGACEWAAKTMKRSGLSNVHLEPWTLSHGWERGHAFAHLTSPFNLTLDVVSYGWTGSTPAAGTSADVIAVNSDLIADEIAQHARLWKNKVLFLTPLGPKHNPLRSYSQLGTLLNAAAKAKAIAVMYPTGRPGIMLPHTGPAVFHDAYIPIPVLDLPTEQDRLLQRLLAANKHLRLKLDIQNTVTTGPAMCANVVGEIPGREHPEEIVVVGAHLDSWDLGTGSIDDGFGVATVLGVADAILFQHIRPRRTIRFVLFTGEEEGLLGSLQYVRAHAADLRNMACAFVMDWGGGPITKLPLAGHTELEPAFTHFTQLLDDVAKISVDHTYLSFTDGYAFTLAGIAGIAPLQDSPNYVSVGHSAADTLDKVNAKNLVLDTAILADAAYWVANYPAPLTFQWSPQKTMNTLTRDNQKTLLELFGLWKFGADSH